MEQCSHKHGINFRKCVPKSVSGLVVKGFGLVIGGSQNESIPLFLFLYANMRENPSGDC